MYASHIGIVSVSFSSAVRMLSCEFGCSLLRRSLDVKLSYPWHVHADRFSYSAENCSIQRSLDIVGERWTLLVLREAFYGVRRFEDFVRASGCPRDALSARLNTLVREGIMRREPYREPGRRARNEYRLTEKGIELFPALLALLQWGDRWAADPGGPAVELTHRDCGEPLQMTMGCGAGHGPLSARDVQARPGPGAQKVA
jgi:DNA-binding HxlR family transcriptional regulator